MIFKKVAMEFDMFEESNMHELKEKVISSCVDAADNANSTSSLLSIKSVNRGSKKLKGSQYRKALQQQTIAKDLTLAFLLCNNVTPVYPDASD